MLSKNHETNFNIEQDATSFSLKSFDIQCEGEIENVHFLVI